MELEEFKKLAALDTNICDMICSVDSANNKFTYSYYKPLSEEQQKLIHSVLKKTLIEGYKKYIWKYYSYKNETHHCYITHNRKCEFQFCFHPLVSEPGKVPGNPKK